VFLQAAAEVMKWPRSALEMVTPAATARAHARLDATGYILGVLNEAQTPDYP